MSDEDGRVWRWIRYDCGRCRTTTTDGPLWSTVQRRITEDSDTSELLEDALITLEVTDKVLHRPLPGGPRNRKTTLFVFRPLGDDGGESAPHGDGVSADFTSSRPWDGDPAPTSICADSLSVIRHATMVCGIPSAAHILSCK